MTFCLRSALGCLVLICALTPMFLQSSPAQSGTQEPASGENRRQQLLSLLDEDWQYELRTNPERATMLGDGRYNDRLSDNSPEFFQSDIEQKREFLARFQAIDPAGFSHQDTLSRELMIRQLPGDRRCTVQALGDAGESDGRPSSRTAGLGLTDPFRCGGRL